MPAPLVWTQLKPGNNPPASRSGHTLTTVGKVYIMFGGLDSDKSKGKDGKTGPNNQVYTLKISGLNCEWKLQGCTGEIPLPRSNHAACPISNDKMLIFGGFFTSKERFNDTYILKTSNFQWSQPPNQKSGQPPKNSQSKIGAPEPRGNHTATFHKNRVYIFGGHGGIDYQRVAFNDLYVLDTDTFEWNKLSPQGNPPDARGGHTASVMATKDKIMIFGGWSFTSQFSNVMVYDITADEWVDPEISHEIPKWNSSGVIAPSIPSWKYFIFGGSVGSFQEGGNRTSSKYVDDAYVLDIDEMKWSMINLEKVEGQSQIVKPKPRQNAAVVYDPNESRVIMFGGWANNWLGDMWSLNVSSITGPPYAIFSVDPMLGPVSGRTRVRITGQGFKDSGSISVKFWFGKMEKEVPGQYISDTILEADTPPFEHPRKTEVVLKIGTQDYTISSKEFTYYLNTKAENTLAYGPGILSDNAAGFETVFYIQARNTINQNRESGRDVFQVKIRRLDMQSEQVAKGGDKRSTSQHGGDGEKEGDKSKNIDDSKLNTSQQQKNDTSLVKEEDGEKEEGKQEGEGSSSQEKKGEEGGEAEEVEQDKSLVKFVLVDKNDGSYEIKYKLDQPGRVEIDIRYKNEINELIPIRGNPFNGQFKEGGLEKDNHLIGTITTKFIGSSLTDINTFIDITQDCIDIRNKNINEDKHALISVMENLYNIEQFKDEQILKLDTIEEMLKGFEKHEVKKETDLKKTRKLQEEWSNLIKRAQTVQKDIQGPVKGETDKTKEQIKKFEEGLKEYSIALKKQSFYTYKTGVDESIKRIGEVKEQLQEFEKQQKEYQYFAKMFSFPDEVQGSQKNLEMVKAEVEAVEKLWKHIKVCEETFANNKQMKWGNVNCGEMEDEIKKKRKTLVDMRGIDKRCNSYSGIVEVLQNWATFLPLLTELKDASMDTDDKRHWKKLKELVKQDFEVNENLVLETVWDLKLFEFKEGIEDITDFAKNELKIERGLQKVTDFWKAVEFEMVKHKNTDVHTLKMSDDNFETLEEHQNQIGNMLLSKYVKYYEKDVEDWKRSLGAVYDVVQLLGDVQKTWSFLENLFIQSEEVKKELPKESEQFIGIDKEMKEIMQQGQQIKNCKEFCTIGGMFKRLDNIQKDLKVCEKALNEFLDSKRRAFPRFYFVSVSDLLDILSNGNNPAKINRHMSKIFQAVETLTLTEAGSDRPTAENMKTGVGSEDPVKFSNSLQLLGKVEVYLQDVIDMMVKTLRDIANSSFKAKQTLERKKWLERDPAQITLLVNNIIWSAEVEDAFNQLQAADMNAMENYKNTSILLLTDLIKLVQGDLTASMRQKIMCLITMDTHSRDVVIKMIAENVRKPDEFQWQSQLKFYWLKNPNNEDDALVRVADASFWYAYEYLGNGPRLVITPLTDRIYVTATQALHLKMGCAPAGPAGTGKTESTKDLANALAKACYVFNCSSEMNYESMGNIYKGLASSGCWGCFDEFNRLLPEVLSVCSVQFKAVTDAIKRNAKTFILEGDEIKLDPSCGVFITMNPGYLGRAELPEGLKALFRPITVVVPDLELICENMLMAEGFVEAKILAQKFVTLYFLCRDLLSKQLHYDWGLRAIKSVLVVAGGFKRAEPEMPEQALLMRALRDFNIPKIAATDLYVFHGLLGDLFPKFDPPRKRNYEFEKVIEDVCLDSKLFAEPQFVLKVVQLQELIAIRHCVFTMGPPGAGKSSTWKMLGKSNDKVGKKTTIIDINPKTVSTKDFYGYNLPSKEWKDGLFSKNMRTLSNMEDTNPKWIILDGDLDANWIESMNSVMDDNKILTLANNERIQLKPHMRLIFEIRDLRFATPATVSRAGILYISDDDGTQWRSYVQSWIQYEVDDENNRKNIQALFDRYVPDTLEKCKQDIRYLIPVSPMAQVISICKALKPMIHGEVKNLEYIFVYSLIWAIGGSLTEKDGLDYRKEFSTWWKGAWKTAVKFPGKGTIFDYYVDNSGDTTKFTEWNKKLPTIEFDPTAGQQMGNITVPTIETLATSEFINTYISVKHGVLMIGMAGGGKTQLSKGILREIVQLKPENYAYQLINFNYYTDSSYLQIQLEQVLEKKAGRQFGPPGKLQMIYFIDDLNMPQRDPYDTQTAIALLRQHADYGHWYDIAKLSLQDIINTQTIAAMNPSAGSFFVDPRYQRHSWTVSIPFPENESLSQIYLTFINGHLKRFRSTVSEYAVTIVRASLMIHQAVSEKFKKTAINFHYEFNLRHLSNIFQGMMLSDPSRYPEPDRMVRLWIHECERTYGDRLVSYEHLKIYRDSMFEIVKKNFTQLQFSKYFQGATPEALIFCNFTGGVNQDRLYDQMPNEKLSLYIEEALKEYNQNNAFMGLVLFDDMMRHITKICRIILPPSGHALLVGVGGSGKQSLSKLASSIMQFNTFQITISATYNMNDLRSDLQNLYNKCGPKEEGTLFLFTEGQITNERFLVYINDLLSSGEISELYNSDEKEVIINLVRNQVKSEGKPDTRDNCWNWFIDQIKKNLHMSICFSPVGDMRRRARQFPALVNCTVIDWFQPWPYEALFNVAQSFLEPVELGTDQVRDAVVQFMPYSFQIVNDLGIKLLEQEKRYAYTTPKSFLELIKLFTNMLGKKREALQKNIERYETGLVKLRETAEQVAIIEVQVKEAQIEAEAKKKEADAFAQVVGKEKEKVEKENSKAEIEQKNCAVIKADVEEQKESTQQDLDAAQPLVEQAKAALNSIKKADFQTAKSWANPPPGVPDVFSACIYMLAGFYPDAIEIDKNQKPKFVDWKGGALKLMKVPDDFIVQLIAYKDVVDQNLVPASNVKIVKEQYLSLPYFNIEAMASKSAAAKGLCDWCINIVKYYDVIQDIEPKRKILKQATEQLEEATIQLNEVEEIVKKLNEALAKLNAEFDRALSEKNAAIAEAEKCERRLNLAQRLVKALSSENERWGKSIIQIQEQLELVVGDVLMASAFVSYAGPFNKKFRTIMINDSFMKFISSNQIPMSSEPDPVKILTNESVIATWNKMKLPTDTVSIENGTILTNSERYALIIDPQLQGITWIREKEKVNNLKTLRLGSQNINSQLELSIEMGYSAIIQNMGDRIDAILMPVISRALIKRGRNKIMKFAGQDLVQSDQFKLFLHTNLSNPHYPPEVQAETALINFMVTEVGLGDQLLTLVVGRERPDLAKMKVELINQQNDFKIKLKELEDELLFKLANAKGDILDDIALIENLEYSQKLSTEIEEKVKIAQVTEAKINETSENYRPAATRGALIYFMLSDLAQIHSFYKYSLESFIVVMNRAIDNISENKMYSGQTMIPYGQEEEGKGNEEHNPAEEQEPQEEAPVEDKPPQSPPQEEKQEDAPAAEQQEGNGGEDKEEGQKEGENAAGESLEKQEEGQQQGTGENEPKPALEGEEAAGNEQAVADGEQNAQGEEGKVEGNQEEKQIDGDEPMSPRSLKERVKKLIEELTFVCFSFCRRGTFERHKIIISSMLTLRILLRSGELHQNEVDHLIIGKMDANPGSIPESLRSFLTENIWAAVKELEKIPAFAGFCQSLETDVLQWKKWYGESNAEVTDLPKAFKEISKFHQLLLLRAMRPDRLTSAMSNFVMEKLGERFIEQPAFSIYEMFEETSNKVPSFFVLFPGVDPTSDVERIGEKHDVTAKNGRFLNISMGQGQEKIAERALYDCAQQGKWIMLQNVHLMQTWLAGLNGLEGFLENVFTNPSTHKNFRVFISSEPPNILLPLQQIIPESILQGAIKVANEAPQFLKANLRRAYSQFDQPFLDKCEKKPNEFKACLFGLCFFHSIILGRKKFGSQGWSRIYNFNDGDLTICADVLFNYLSQYEVVPWDDLRYIFGEIMYGGHITDDWDRRTNRTYLKVLIRPELLQSSFNLGPNFKSPDPAKFDYEAYKRYIEDRLPSETPQMFGMHPNAEIGYLTTMCDDLFKIIQEVQGGSSGGGGQKDDGVMTTILDFKSRIPKEFDLFDINAKVKEKTPFVVVLLQEVQRMNYLLAELKSSLEDLRLGLTGALNITDAMELLSMSLQFNRVPAVWEAKAYFSQKVLGAWFNDLIERCLQLTEWSQDNLETPKSLNISYLFNPMSFLTAIMQNTARVTGQALDFMTIQTNVTVMQGPEDVVNSAEQGAYIHGYFLEGAAWEMGAQGQDGYLIEQKPKELHPQMPVINAVSVPLEQKRKLGQYECPVYATSQRGPTFIYTANLNMESEDADPNKWILSGTCLLGSDD